MDLRALAHKVYPVCPTFAANVGQPDEHSQHCDAIHAAFQRVRDEALVEAEKVVAQVDVPLSLKNRGAVRDAIARLRRGAG